MEICQPGKNVVKTKAVEKKSPDLAVQSVFQSVPWLLRKTQNTRPTPAINEYFIQRKYSFKVIWIIIGIQEARINPAMAQQDNHSTGKITDNSYR